MRRFDREAWEKYGLLVPRYRNLPINRFDRDGQHYRCGWHRSGQPGWYDPNDKEWWRKGKRRPFPFLDRGGKV